MCGKHWPFEAKQLVRLCLIECEQHIISVCDGAWNSVKQGSKGTKTSVER